MTAEKKPKSPGLMNLPKRVANLNAWLTSRGAEVLAPTNEWEVTRWRADGETHVLYRRKTGFLSMSPAVEKAVFAFLGGKPWSAGVATPRRSRSSTEVRTLLVRDGDECFLCGHALGDDCTVEHLVALAHGGPNHIANKALAHERCNNLMGHLSLMQKIRLREETRAANLAQLEIS
jgi:hypothetical protein